MPSKFEDRTPGGPSWQDRTDGPVWDRQMNEQVFYAKEISYNFTPVKKTMCYIGED